MKLLPMHMGALLLLFIASAHAADIDLDKVPEVSISVKSSPYYLKGYTGFGFSGSNRLGTFNSGAKNADYHWKNHGDGDSAFLGGVGLGWRLNDIVRFDGTIEYRNENTVTGSDQNSGAIRKYKGDVASTVIMANAYTDLLTYHNITPFIGAGLGTTANRVSHFVVHTPTNDYKASTRTKWDIAWAAHAGFAVKLSQNLIFDIAYSYSDLGEAKTNHFSDISALDVNHLTSHDVTLGIRYAF